MRLVCIVPMNTFTLELEEPGKHKLISSTEARKKMLTLADPIVITRKLKRYFSRLSIYSLA